MGTIIFDKNGECVKVGTVMYNPFFGDYWKVINEDNVLLVELLDGRYKTELDDVIDTFIVAQNYIQKR